MVTREQLDQLLEQGRITQEEYDQLVIEIVPSLWIETNVCDPEGVTSDGSINSPLVLRWYQRQVVNCESRKIVLRFGRQTGKTHMLGVDSIYRTRVYPGSTALIVVPFNHQCLIIYDKIMNFIQSSPVLSDMLLSSTKNPFVIKWKDNGQIKLFTAGASSGGTADSVRGQSSRWLYIDEADYVPESALDAILMTVASFGNSSRVIFSSTPQGPKTYFYDMCNSERWEEFHHSSHVSPTWTSEMDITARETLGETGYKHEVLAEFSDAEQGVFKYIYIDKSFNVHLKLDNRDVKHYTYGDSELIRKQMKTFVIGVDWNSSTYGTQIVLLGVSQDHNQLYLLKHIEITKEQFTQMSAVETVVGLIMEYNPMYVYVDEGYGCTQIEVMHRMGKVNTNLGLDEKLVGVNFSSNIEVWDPITGEMKLKYAKAFMVDNLSRLLERNLIHFPQDERISSGGNGRKKIESMLRGYLITRVSPNGKPVYECEGAEDHKLDAVMLACLAYTQHYKKISDRSFGVKPIIPRVMERKLYSKTIGETPIIQRSLTQTMNTGDRNRISFHPEKEDYNDFLQRVKNQQTNIHNRSINARFNVSKLLSRNVVNRRTF